jgi:DNA-binding GntR family transcriptional regulator
MSKRTSLTFETTERGQKVTLQEWVYQQLRQAIMTGRFVPGRTLTIRGIAGALEVSPMPVREALRRLVAERALELLGNRRVKVPDMTPARFEELCTARISLETLAAERALPFIDKERLALLRRIDAEIDSAMAAGETELYMTKNQEFHMTMYRAAPSEILVPVIESLWLLFGPFMRLVLSHLDDHYTIDRHVEALAAIERRDPYALRIAIEADIRDGISHLGKAELLESYYKGEEAA